LVAICEKAMAREIERRHADMNALAIDLRDYLEGRPVRAHKTGMWTRLRKWVQRHKAFAALIALLTMAMVGVPSFVFHRQREEIERAAKENELSGALYTLILTLA
jgi:serine/threonine-protein kinase